jgi:hypothetical protein
LEGNKIFENFPGNRIIEFENSQSGRGVWKVESEITQIAC